MKQLNGKPIVVATIAARFEFDIEDAKQVLAAKAQDQPRIVLELLNRTLPAETYAGNYLAETFKKAVGEALVNQMEREMKQLPETTETH